MLRVLSPVAGHSLEVRDLPDPVFARGLLGPGLAIRPRHGLQTAVAPVAGRIVKLHPHAYLILSEQGKGVLVHLGIDTVHKQGDGFTLHAHEHDDVVAGEDIVSWDPSYVDGTGRSSICAVVMPDCDPAIVEPHAVNTDVEAGDLLFEVEC
jgi:glucose-specific phosphotransferase system IIA component